jgi:hypothetical protein
MLNRPNLQLLTEVSFLIQRAISAVGLQGLQVIVLRVGERDILHKYLRN